MARYSITLRAQDYHVALLAAIGKEYVIACALLDERHNDPLDRLEDQRFYAFGRIHQHNVVIARLPEGTVGIDASAAVSADLANAFPNLRFGLMVGIAGGAPTKDNDIRLGDIVVSLPSDKGRSGGVVQYDFGASIQTKGLVRRGWLDRPPLVLLNAVGELQARYQSDGHNFEKILQQILGKNSEGRLDAYQKPKTARDFLFMPDFVHVDESNSCDEIGCNEREDKIVARPARSKTTEEPVIHLGTIGSGGLLMRDAILRDKIAKEDGVKCFEMESAGLMNSRLPWLVIRGISDYADTHKHDEWQNYAAAVAAIYAKELLSIVRPVITVRSTEDPDGGGELETLDLFRNLRYERMDYKRQFAMPGKSFDLEWVWSTEFKNWLSHASSNRPFWMCGKPGSGKSTMMAYLCHNERTRTILRTESKHFQILHYFYDYRAGAGLANNIDGMLRMLLYQLAKRLKVVRIYLCQDLKHQREDFMSTSTLLDKVCEVLTLDDFRACIFIDGLDEYEGSYIELLQTCRTIIQRTGTKLCIASRPEVPVKQILQIHSEIFLQDHNISSMEAYARESIVAASVNDIDIENIMSTSLQQTIIHKAEGIILWFKLAFDEVLRICLAGSGKEAVQRALQELPLDLNAMYQRILGLLPAAHLNECALLLFVVREFHENAGMTHGPATITLDDLWGAYNFLSAHSEIYRRHRKISNRDEFQNHLKIILRGLVEVAPAQRAWYQCDVRFIHKSFATFISKSTWIKDNLSTGFKQKYPDTFVLRFYASIIMRASTDNIISADVRQRYCREKQQSARPRDIGFIKHYTKWIWAFLREIPILNGHRSLSLAVSRVIYGLDADLTRRRRWERDHHNKHAVKLALWFLSQILPLVSSNYDLPTEWQIRRSILFLAIRYMLPAAEHYEDKGGSVLDIIGPPLCTHFDILFASRSGVLSVQGFMRPEIIHEVTANHLHLLIMVCGRLTDSLVESLANHQINSDVKADLLTLVIYEHAYKSIASPDKFPILFDRILTERKIVQRHHLCDLLSEGACLGDAARVAHHLIPYLKLSQGESLKYENGDICTMHGSRCNLLLRWAHRTRRCRWPRRRIAHTRHGKYPCRELLSLLIAYGVDLNKPLGAAGTVLHAILDVSVIKKQANTNKALVPPKPFNREQVDTSKASSLSMTYDKFLALALHGVDPMAKGKGGMTALQVAQRSKNKLLRAWREPEEQDEINNILGSIIEWLESYNQTGMWPSDLLEKISSNSEPYDT